MCLFSGLLYVMYLYRFGDCIQSIERMKQVNIIYAAQSTVILWIESDNYCTSLLGEGSVAAQSLWSSGRLYTSRSGPEQVDCLITRI